MSQPPGYPPPPPPWQPRTPPPNQPPRQPQPPQSRPPLPRQPPPPWQSAPPQYQPPPRQPSPDGRSGPPPPGSAAPQWLSKPAAPPVAARRRVPVGLLIGLAVTVFILVTKPAIIMQTLSSAFALVVVVGIIAAFAAFAYVLRRIGTPAMLRGSLLGVAALVLGYLLIWPFYRSDVFAPASATAAPPVAAPAATGAAARTGTFSGLGGHSGSGKASLLRTASGFVVRLDNVNIQDGPRLNAYLVPGANQQSPSDGAILLGPFGGSAGTRGDFNYPVPAGTRIDPAATYTMLIYCEPFQVPVSGATLS